MGFILLTNVPIRTRPKCHLPPRISSRLAFPPDQDGASTPVGHRANLTFLDSRSSTDELGASTPSFFVPRRFRSALKHSRISPGSTRITKTSSSATVNAPHLLLMGEALCERWGDYRTARSGSRPPEPPYPNPRATARLPRGRIFRRIPPARRRQHHACRRMETPTSGKETPLSRKE